jgi:hypothetical protein
MGNTTPNLPATIVVAVDGYTGLASGLEYYLKKNNAEWVLIPGTSFATKIGNFAPGGMFSVALTAGQTDTDGPTVVAAFDPIAKYSGFKLFNVGNYNHFESGVDLVMPIWFQDQAVSNYPVGVAGLAADVLVSINGVTVGVPPVVARASLNEATTGWYDATVPALLMTDGLKVLNAAYTGALPVDVDDLWRTFLVASSSAPVDTPYTTTYTPGTVWDRVAVAWNVPRGSGVPFELVADPVQSVVAADYEATVSLYDGTEIPFSDSLGNMDVEIATGVITVNPTYTQTEAWQGVALLSLWQTADDDSRTLLKQVRLNMYYAGSPS